MGSGFWLLCKPNIISYPYLLAPIYYLLATNHMLPKVAIVGRPNVGKSSLFNWLANVRISIVEPTPAVTRDRLSTPIELDENCWVDLIDTGGRGIVDRDNLTEHVEKQIAIAINEAAVVLF